MGTCRLIRFNAGQLIAQLGVEPLNIEHQPLTGDWQLSIDYIRSDPCSMTPDDLLKHFQAAGPLYEIRESAAFTELAAAIPDDPQAYVQIVDEFFGPLDGNFEEIYDGPLFEVAERLQEILRELYYYDFRTFEALLLQCDLALKDRTESGFGIHPTAALASYPPPKGRGFADDQAFLRKVEPYLASPDMRHNIRGVRQRLLRRSPGLAVTPDTYPPT